MKMERAEGNIGPLPVTPEVFRFKTLTFRLCGCVAVPDEGDQRTERDLR